MGRAKKGKRRQLQDGCEIETTLCPLKFFTKTHGTDHIAKRITRNLSEGDVHTLSHVCQCFPLLEDYYLAKQSAGSKVIETIKKAAKKSSPIEFNHKCDAEEHNIYLIENGESFVILEHPSAGHITIKKFELNAVRSGFHLVQSAQVEIPSTGAFFKTTKVNRSVIVISIQGKRDFVQILKVRDLTLSFFFIFP